MIESGARQNQNLLRQMSQVIKSAILMSQPKSPRDIPPQQPQLTPNWLQHWQEFCFGSDRDGRRGEVCSSLLASFFDTGSQRHHNQR